MQLSDIAAGYILSIQDSYRVENIVNISNSDEDGITLVAKIPGTIDDVDYHKNNSPAFLFKDTAIICYNGNFSYPFSATDADGDSISYVFGNGLNANNMNGVPPSNPPYSSLAYNSGYSGTSPLGSGVTIDPVTGLISGRAPSITGEYVVAVYAKEWRKGVLIDSIKKELQIYVYNCSISAASANHPLLRIPRQAKTPATRMLRRVNIPLRSVWPPARAAAAASPRR